MALNTLLIIAAGLGAGLGQEPSIDTQIVTPVSNRAASPALMTPADSDDKISVHFHDAKPSEVLDCLEKQGINFMVSKSEINDDTRITINVDNQPVEDVLNALARAIGGHWERENGVRVYRKGGATWFDGNTGSQFSKFMPAMPMTKDGKPLTPEQWDKTFGKDWAKKTEDWQKQFGPEFQKKMELFGKEMPGQFSTDVFKKFQGDGDVHVFTWDGDAFKQLQGDGKLSKEQAEQIRKQIAEAGALGEKMRIQIETQMKDGDKGGAFKMFTDKDGKVQIFGDKSPDVKILTDKDGKVQVFGDKDSKVRIFTDKDGKVKVFGDTDPNFKLFTDKSAKVNVFGDKGQPFKFFSDKDGTFQFLDKDGKTKVFTLPKDGQFFPNGKDGKFQFFDKDGKAKVYTLPKDGQFFSNGKDGIKFWTTPGSKFFTDGKVFKTHSFGLSDGLDVKKFMDSLTDDQQDKQHKRGYIRYSDLTAEQKKILGEKPDGKFEITFKINGDQITVRND